VMGTYLFTEISARSMTRKPLVIPAPAVEPEAVEEPSAKPAVSPVELALSSKPAGAQVSRDGVIVCRSTPCSVTLTGDDAAPGEELELTFIRRGYRRASIRRTIEGPTLDIHTNLSRRSSKRRRGTAAKKAPAPLTELVEDKPYKANPY